ncbi:hypothetical protein ES692_03850 [Psychroserpens burtonensis]|uniref:Porin family protein n=1 Tax=Psychroserpens burtonensis TaxID=49278 RepID=A0A5C7BAB0_9FLAO|nr:hypothetical protein [Psychroserpens burtonensis]TXE19424.1 hypothetical protein ES692_03850 [Psychroserpens burtonensis]
MKQISTLLLLFFFTILHAQDDQKTSGLFYKASLSATLTNNEDYTIGNDNDESFINLNGIFFNNTLGYQFDIRSSIGLNIEYDHYLDQSLNFLPVYLDFTYNIFDFDDQVFIRGGYGKLVDLGKAFENGNMYKAGIGYRAYDDDFKNSWLIGFDFSRKRFSFRQEEKLSSFAVFLEFMLF